MIHKPTEPSLFGAILVYGVPGALGWYFFGEIGLLISLASVFLLRGFTDGPLFRSRMDENVFIYGDAAREAKERRARNQKRERTTLPVKQTWIEATTSIFGPAIGLPLVVAAMLGAFASISPLGCSGGGEFEREYRSR